MMKMEMNIGCFFLSGEFPLLEATSTGMVTTCILSLEECDRTSLPSRAGRRKLWERRGGVSQLGQPRSLPSAFLMRWGISFLLWGEGSGR